MEPQELTDYERLRLENIRRNGEMMAALKLHSAAAQLSKRPRVTTQSEKKPKIETPAVIRRSLRTRGIPPESKVKTQRPLAAHILGSFPMTVSDCSVGKYDRSFLKSIVGMAKKKSPDDDDVRDKTNGSFELGYMSLNAKNIARVVPEKLTALRFFPSSSGKMIVAGNNLGNLGFWDVEAGELRGSMYRPHLASISGILVQPHCLSKIYTSCYDGCVRLMDAQQEVFDLVYCSDECIYNLNQPKNEANCLYFAEGSGVLTVRDMRRRKCSSSKWVLHHERIHTIDFNCENPHIVATSSTDGTARIWDLRYSDGNKPSALRTLTHNRGLLSAYFSPSGRSLAITRLDKTISIYGGVNLEDEATIYHDNRTSYSAFRGIWGWDDSLLFIGNQNRGIDAVSAVQRKTVMTLESPHVTANQFRLEPHPYEVGTIAAGSSGGAVFIWTLS